MADVIPGSRSGDDRGQMLLIAAFGVAVMLVALALILNTAIYTENIATRGSDISGGKDAIRYRAATQESVDGTVTYVNYHNNSSADARADYGPLRTQVRWAVWNYSNLSGKQQAMDSIATNTSVVSQSNGARIYQHADRNFSNDADVRNWTVVEGTTGTRNVTLNLTTGLASEDPSDVAPTKSTTKFYLNFTDSSSPGSEWVRVYIFNDTGSPATTYLKVYSQADGLEGTCTAQYGSDGRMTVDVTGTQMGGSGCPALAAVEDVYTDEFDLLFNNTKDGPGSYTIFGKYSLVANTSGTSFSAVSDVDVGGGYPAKTRAIYSVTVHVIYESERLYFETDVRSAPGEFDD